MVFGIELTLIVINGLVLTVLIFFSVLLVLIAGCLVETKSNYRCNKIFY